MIQGGYPFYGQKVGILVFKQKTPRVPGDPGHSGTFNYQVCYEIVEGKFSDLIKGSEEIKRKLIEAVLKLKSRGIEAVIGDCGLMSLYQREMAGHSNIPILSSSLVLAPIIWTVMGKKGSIGILTGHSELLCKEHLVGAGINDDISYYLQGMEDEPHFSEVVIDGGDNLDIEKMKEDILNAIGKMLSKKKDINAILIECSNLATYSRDIYEKFKIPVFDIVSGAKLIEYSINPPRFL